MNAEDERERALSHLLSGFRFQPAWPYSARIQQALYLARALQSRATLLQTPQERRQQAELDRMLQTPSDKVTMIRYLPFPYLASVVSQFLCQSF